MIVYFDLPEWLGSHLVQLIPQGLLPFAFNAFMLPLGTQVNALLFGGVKNLSLATMAASGFILNIISVLWIAEFLLHCYLITPSTK